MRTSPAEQQDHLNHWRASGTSMAAYCRQNDIPYHRMVYWRQREARCIPREGKSDLQPVTGVVPAFDCVDLNSDDQLGAAIPRMEILFPNGVCLQFHAAVHPDELRVTIEAVNAC